MKYSKMLITFFILTLSAIFVSAYSAPSYDNVNLVLTDSYTAPDYDNVNLVLILDINITDTCTAPSTNNDWTINTSDYCNITSNVDLGTGDIIFIGSDGRVLCDAVIDVANLVDVSVDKGLLVDDDCIINVG